MSFFTCELRCHILDREDQLQSCKSHRKFQQEELAKLRHSVQVAQDRLQKYEEHLAKREKFISLVESTLHRSWIERPDLEEKAWMEE